VHGVPGTPVPFPGLMVTSSRNLLCKGVVWENGGARAGGGVSCFCSWGLCFRGGVDAKWSLLSSSLSLVAGVVFASLGE
jgi:hypothetical protein